MSNERIDDDPAARVEVPKWLEEIEARQATGILSPAGIYRDLDETIRHYRELLVVLHDLRQDAGPAYVVVASTHYEGDQVEGVFNSQDEAMLYARTAAGEDEEHTTHYLVEEWVGTCRKQVADYPATGIAADDDGTEECPACGGEGEVEAGPTHEPVECEHCHGSGRYTP